MARALPQRWRISCPISSCLVSFRLIPPSFPFSPRSLFSFLSVVLSLLRGCLCSAVWHLQSDTFTPPCHLRAIICHLRVATHTPWLRRPTVENSPRGFARTKLDYLNPSSLDDETQADESCCWACSLWGRHMILNPTNTLKTPFLIILKIFTFCTLKYKLGHEVCKALFR